VLAAILRLFQDKGGKLLRMKPNQAAALLALSKA